MRVAEHGGRCCGISVIFNILPLSDDVLVEFKRLISGVKRARPSGCIEVCMIDQQLTGQIRQEAIYGGARHAVGGDWPAVLLRLGFRIVARFRNSNHGNTVNVWHLHYGAMQRDIPAVPFEYAEPIPPVNNAEPIEIQLPAPAPRAVREPILPPQEILEAAERALRNQRVSPSSRIVCEWLAGL